MPERPGKFGERQKLTPQLIQELEKHNPYRDDPTFRRDVEAAKDNRWAASRQLIDETKTAPPREALRAAWLAWTLCPNYVTALKRLTKLYLKLDQKREALAVLLAAIHLEPKNPINFSVAATCLSDLNQHDRALSCAKRSHELSPTDPMSVYTVGKVLRAAERHAEARPWLERAIASGVRTRNAYIDLAAALYFTDEYEAGLRATLEASMLDPKNLFARRLRISCLYRLGRWYDAAEELEALDNISPEHHGGVSGVRPFIFYRVKKYTQGLSSAEDLLKREPENARAKTLAVSCLVKLGRYQEALQRVEDPQVIGLEHGLWLKSKSLALLGHRERSIETLIKVIQTSTSPKLAYLAALFSLAPEGHNAHGAVKALLKDPILYAQAIDLSRRFNWAVEDPQDEILYSQSVANMFNSLAYDRPVNRMAVRELKSSGKK